MPSANPASWSFLVDEDMPRSTARELRAAGYQVEDVRDVGLSSQSDSIIFAYAQAHQQTLLTADMGFANIVQFPLGTHAGIVVTRFPNTLPTTQVNQQILQGLTLLSGQTLTGILVIIEPGRTRVRRLS
jgi:predicted nuclease of predicted toxin-antitoxin system